jgi:hypothetical protein
LTDADRSRTLVASRSALPLDDPANLQVLHRDSPLEAQREHGVPKQVGDIELLLALIAGDAQHPKADIIVHTEGHHDECDRRSTWLFARNPDQWQTLQHDAAPIPNAVNGVVRMESAVRAFGRRAERDTEIAGTRIPAGSRVLVMFASANRD